MVHIVLIGALRQKPIGVSLSARIVPQILATDLTLDSAVIFSRLTGLSMTNWLTHDMAKITVHLSVGRVPLQISKVNSKFRELYSPHTSPNYARAYVFSRLHDHTRVYLIR